MINRANVFLLTNYISKLLQWIKETGLLFNVKEFMGTFIK